MDQLQAWDERYKTVEWPTEPDPHLVSFASDLPPGRALDLGCGPGRNAIWLALRGWSVLGIDGSAVGLDQAKQRADKEGVILELQQADLLEYRASSTFDLVVMANIHPEPAKRAALLNMAAEAVGPGGHLFVVGHHLNSLGRTGPPEADRLYTAERLIEAVPRTLVIDQLQEVPSHPEDLSNGSGDESVLMSVVLWASPTPS